MAERRKCMQIREAAAAADAALIHQIELHCIKV